MPMLTKLKATLYAAVLGAGVVLTLQTPAEAAGCGAALIPAAHFSTTFHNGSNVRSGPSTGCETVVSVSAGTSAEVYCYIWSDDNYAWVFVATSGKSGWTRSDNLNGTRTIPPC
jgi:uncharacterized protein YraI